MESESKKICPKCGNILSADVRFCPKCGQLVGDASTSQRIVYEKYKGFWTTGRLVFGIFSILIFVFMVFQSCIVGALNTFSSSGDMGGTQGMLTAIMYLSAGITGVASRNSSSKGGPLASAILYWIGALFTAGGSDVYGDLAVWGVLAAILGLFFMYCAIRTDGDLKEKKRIIWFIVSVVITAILIVISASVGEEPTENVAEKGKEYELESRENKEKIRETREETVREKVVETTTELLENVTDELPEGTYIYDDGNTVYNTAEVLETDGGLQISIDSMGYGGHQQGFASGYLNGLGADTYSCIDENDNGTFILKITKDGFEITAHPVTGVEDMFSSIEGHYVYSGLGNAKADGYFDEDWKSQLSEPVGANEPYNSDSGDTMDEPQMMIVDSSSRLITDADVYWMTPEQLRIAIKNTGC